MSRIADALGAAREVIESNHPAATVKVSESGGCDFRISSVGASITVTANKDNLVTDEDIDEIVEKGTEAVSGRRLEYRKEEEGTVWFELHS